jgi:hypothetical protein
LSDKARTALDIDALLSSIENQTASEPNVESIDKLLGSLQSLTQAIKPVPAQPAEPQKFEDVVDHVAQAIRTKVDETEIKYQEATNVADALTALATAARNGQRQPMMVAGRAVATHIAAIEKELRVRTFESRSVFFSLTDTVLIRPSLNELATRTRPCKTS